MFRLSPLVLALLLFLLSACSAPQPPAPVGEQSATAELGITLVGIHLSAAGYMLDFRFRVDDPAKAAPMFDRKIIPYLIHDESGAKFAIPSPAKTGPLRQMPRSSEAGRVYWIFFANPAQYVKTGDHVTIVHGPYRFEHLEVL